jgi:glycosyltransferase involved in cell wall biosynthesis
LASAEGLRIALFSGNYNYTRDGANNALNKLVAHLLDHGAAVRVYSPTSINPAFEPVGELVSVPSIPIPGRSEFRVALGLPRAIQQDVERFQPNLFHLSAPDWLGTAAQRFGTRLGVPLVASLHTRFELYLEYYRLGVLRNWAWRRQQQFYRRCDLVLAPNHASKVHLRQMGVTEQRIRMWSRGVDSSRFSPERRDWGWRRELGYNDSDAVILFFGRIVREKGIDCFVRTIRELRIRGYRVRPLVIGEGPARREMENTLGDAVFTGHLEGAELGRAVASADILLNPSTTEAFGNVNLEAMASGLAVISANVESAHEIIQDERDGLLSRPEPGDFANRLEMLLEQPWTRIGLAKAAIRSARERRWPEILGLVVHAYREVQGSITTRQPEVRREHG